jgi:uncharacterized protein (TIGR03790 family)
LINYSLTNTINYIVTTKGVPLKINRGNTFSTSSPSSSLESELMIIMSSRSDQIGKNGYVMSPYFLSTQNFSKSAFDMYLVTRLDGYSFNDIKNLIDKSSSPAVIDTSFQFVLDEDPNWNNSLPYLNNAMTYAGTKLSAKGLKVNVEQTNAYLTEQSNVIGYTSWGSNDYNANLYTEFAKPKNFWAPGAIAETYVSTSGRTFLNPVSYGQSVIADLVAEGVTGAKGYAYEPYSNAMAVVWVLFDRYTDGFNLAESYFMASRSLSWMDVVIGDPKMRIIIPSAPDLPIQLSSFVGNYFNGNNVQLEWTTVSEINNYGFNVQRYNENSKNYETIGFVSGKGTTLAPQTYSYIDKNITGEGIQYRLEQIDNNGLINYYGPIILNPSGIKEQKIEVAKFKLYQNYPNPFNPYTEIKFSLPRSGYVNLKIYNSLGQEVSELLNGELTEGLRVVQFDGSNLTSGIYFSVLRTDNSILKNKMTLVK